MRVEQGFITAPPPDDNPSEAVLLHFDASVIDVTTLLEVHVHTHASTSAHSMRGKYRSAVYTFDDRQRTQCADSLQQLQPDFTKPLITRVLSFVAFSASDDKYQNYYYSNPNKPFCKTWIHPKLQLIRQRFTDNYSSVLPQGNSLLGDQCGDRQQQH